MAKPLETPLSVEQIRSALSAFKFLVELEAEERRAAFDQACAQDPVVRSRVEAILAREGPRDGRPAERLF